MRQSRRRQSKDISTNQDGSSHENETEKTPMKRSRRAPTHQKVYFACTPCRTSKVRCDNMNPCARCLKHNWTNKCVRQVPSTVVDSIVSKSEESKTEASFLEETHHHVIQRSLAASSLYNVILEELVGLKSPMAIHDFVTGASTIKMQVKAIYVF
jgi:hypothetical protein